MHKSQPEALNIHIPVEINWPDLKVLDFELQRRQSLFYLKLLEGCCQQFSDRHATFAPHQVQQHAVAQLELAVQCVWQAFDHVPGNCRLHFCVQHQDDNTCMVSCFSTID